MRASVLKIMVVGALEPASAAALREVRVAVDEAPDGSWLSLLRAVRSSKPQLVLARAGHLNAALVGRATSVPVVIEAGAGDATNSVAWASRLAARTICGSAALRDALLALGAPPAKVSILRSLLPSAAPQDAPAKVDGGPTWVVCAAPIDEEDRGVSDLLLAFLSVARSRPDARLLLAGPGGGARAIHQAEAAGLRGRVSWLPATPALLAQTLSTATVFVGPARTPAYADAVPEAMLAGAAILATAVGPHPAWLREGKTGFLVPPKAPVALAARLGQLLDDAALCSRLGAEARRTALEWCTPRAQAQELARCFQSVTRPLSSMAVPLLQRKMA